MRATLDIAPDVLQAAKGLARQEGSTAGEVISNLARRGLTAPSARTKKSFTIRNGIPVFPQRDEIITLEHVRELMDKEGI